MRPTVRRFIALSHSSSFIPTSTARLQMKSIKHHLRCVLIFQSIKVHEKNSGFHPRISDFPASCVRNRKPTNNLVLRNAFPKTLAQPRSFASDSLESIFIQMVVLPSDRGNLTCTKRQRHEELFELKCNRL